MISSDFVILSIIGSHAKEGPEVIIRRKRQDIQDAGQTYWLFKAGPGPARVRGFCAQARDLGQDVYCVLIAPARRTGGARPTTCDDEASEYTADDGENWNTLPNKLSPVKGKLPAYALVLGSLDIVVNESVNLLDYTDGIVPEKPIRFNSYRSTACARRGDRRNAPHRLKNNSREVIAVGKLIAPFCVGVR